MFSLISPIPISLLPFVMVLTPPHKTILTSQYYPLANNTKQRYSIHIDYSGVLRRCKKSFESETEESSGDIEVELLEFMKNSKDPNKFPTKRELIEGGRRDLVDAILRIGGWMTMGWIDSNDDDGSEVFSSGRSLELGVEDNGIDGILQRLERQRNLTFGLKLGKNGTATDYVNGEFDGGNQSEGKSMDVDSCHTQRNKPASLSHERPMFDGNELNRPYSDNWRTWSIQRAGSLDTEFEAGEIDFGENTKQGGMDKPVSEIVAVTADIRRARDETKDLDSYYREVTQGDLKARLQILEEELSSALHVLKSNTIDISGKAKEHLPEDLRQLSDFSEFQENEIMNVQDKLRSLRANLAVLEGKMALAIIDAQTKVSEKQKRIDDARKALQLLRTTCIAWPNSGSEVLLAGSFDGWATQRKMTRSSTGVFSLFLKLYPGKYEIKFIVDGVWKVDPLRPVVNNNGFENNLLTVS